MYNIDTLLMTARKEIGYLEKATNDKLDLPLANPGSSNYTKYGRDRGCNGLPWCGAFVCSMFIDAYGKYAADGLLHGFSNYTPTMAGFFKKKGLFVKSQPQPGDVIFFKNSQRICHVGIVERVDGGRVYTIEGNTSAGTTLVPNGGCVAAKSYPLNYSRIAGYGRPNYSGTDTPTLYKGCQGVAVGKLQIRLNEKFPNTSMGKLDVDCDFGAKTQTKLIEAQGLMGVNVNKGICDSATWGKLR